MVIEVCNRCGDPVEPLPARFVYYPVDAVRLRWCRTCATEPAPRGGAITPNWHTQRA